MRERRQVAYVPAPGVTEPEPLGRPRGACVERGAPRHGVTLERLERRVHAGRPPARRAAGRRGRREVVHRPCSVQRGRQPERGKCASTSTGGMQHGRIYSRTQRKTCLLASSEVDTALSRRAKSRYALVARTCTCRAVARGALGAAHLARPGRCQAPRNSRDMAQSYSDLDADRPLFRGRRPRTAGSSPRQRLPFPFLCLPPGRLYSASAG